MPLFKSLDASLQTLGIFPAVNKFVIAVQDVTNSAIFTDSTVLQVDLIAGATYDFQTYELIGSSAFATAGAQSQLAYTGTGTFYGTRFRGGVSDTEPINSAPSWGGSGDTVNGVVNEPAKSLLVQRTGRIVTSTSGVLKVQFRQSTAVAAHYARLHIGSYLQVQRVS
jgi:hypothetical protein